MTTIDWATKSNASGSTKYSLEHRNLCELIWTASSAFSGNYNNLVCINKHLIRFDVFLGRLVKNGEKIYKFCIIQRSIFYLLVPYSCQLFDMYLSLVKQNENETSKTKINTRFISRSSFNTIVFMRWFSTLLYNFVICYLLICRFFFAPPAPLL